ncbi:MAG: DUF1778 domain-containing protein [Methylococcales bacterium]
MAWSEPTTFLYPGPPARSLCRTLNLRIRPEERSLIDRSAKARGKNRTEFPVRLHLPPNPNERLEKTIKTSASGDEQ